MASNLSLKTLANAAGIATGSNISLNAVNASAGSETGMNSYQITSIDSITGYNNIDEATTEEYTMNFTGAGTGFNNRVRTNATNFVWAAQDAGVTLESTPDYTCDVTGVAVTDDYAQNYVVSGVDASFHDGLNTTATNYNTVLSKTINVYDTYNGTGVCFLPGTEILMADGSVKKIEQLFIDDEVMSTSIPGLHDEDSSNRWKDYISESTNGFTHSTSFVVNHWWAFENHYYDINNGQLKVTQEHPVFIKKGNIYKWSEAMDIEVGDYLVQYSTDEVTEVEVQGIVRVEQEIEVVSIDVEDIDVYYANGFLVHNKGSN